MNRYTIALTIIILFAQCSMQVTEASRILNRAENVIEQYPDSSLAILNTLKLDSLQTKRDRARYSLLKSIALDKLYQ